MTLLIGLLGRDKDVYKYGVIVFLALIPSDSDKDSVDNCMFKIFLGLIVYSKDRERNILRGICFMSRIWSSVEYLGMFILGRTLLNLSFRLGGRLGKDSDVVVDKLGDINA
jgi:hypothetical protein